MGNNRTPETSSKQNMHCFPGIQEVAPLSLHREIIFICHVFMFFIYVNTTAPLSDHNNIILEMGAYHCSMYSNTSITVPHSPFFCLELPSLSRWSEQESFTNRSYVENILYHCFLTLLRSYRLVGVSMQTSVLFVSSAPFLELCSLFPIENHLHLRSYRPYSNL